MKKKQTISIAIIVMLLTSAFAILLPSESLR